MVGCCDGTETAPSMVRVHDVQARSVFAGSQLGFSQVVPSHSFPYSLCHFHDFAVNNKSLSNAAEAGTGGTALSDNASQIDPVECLEPRILCFCMSCLMRKDSLLRPAVFNRLFHQIPLFERRDRSRHGVS